MRYDKIFAALNNYSTWTLEYNSGVFTLEINVYTKQYKQFEGDTLDNCLQDFVDYVVDTGAFV